MADMKSPNLTHRGRSAEMGGFKQDLGVEASRSDGGQEEATCLINSNLL